MLPSGSGSCSLPGLQPGNEGGEGKHGASFCESGGWVCLSLGLSQPHNGIPEVELH